MPITNWNAEIVSTFGGVQAWNWKHASIGNCPSIQWIPFYLHLYNGEICAGYSFELRNGYQLLLRTAILVARILYHPASQPVLTDKHTMIFRPRLQHFIVSPIRPRLMSAFRWWCGYELRWYRVVNVECHKNQRTGTNTLDPVRALVKGHFPPSSPIQLEQLAFKIAWNGDSSPNHLQAHMAVSGPRRLCVSSCGIMRSNSQPCN